MPRLEDALSTAYRHTFLQALQDGSAKPLLIPYSILGSHVIPILWLTIPHVSRPWLYQTRWIVVAFTIVFNVHAMTVTSSTNFGLAYSSGMWLFLGIIQCLNLLVWTRPQFEAARVIKVVAPKPKPEAEPADTPRQNGGTLNGHATLTSQTLKLRKSVSNAPLEKIAESETGTGDEIEYRWQKFPAKAPFLVRLGWVMDLMFSLRGCGWNFSISTIPRPVIPQIIQDNAKVDVDSVPRKTAAGFSHPVTARNLLRTCLIKALLSYIVLDFLNLQMKRDPYYLVGPNNEYEPPPHIANKSPWSLALCRQSYFLVGVLISITYYFYVSNIFQYYLFKIFFPSRAFLWNFPSMFGSFSDVLDRGLAGWWGSWWHQTFRLVFLAPSVYLLKKGYLKRRTVAADLFGLFISFFQSGLLHAAGSYTAIPHTRPWDQLRYFLFQGLGIVVQQYLSLALRSIFPKMPRAMRRCGNLAFSILWMFVTSPMFLHDMISCAIWMHESVPISVFRLLGLGPALSLGYADNAWWRWDKEYFLKFYETKHWWEAGFAL
ncbi:hypothetical protein E4U42_003571 [Claviceps africana]|uniref:Wax synthase domain-containing protein n=1 Tax=Claviceps africana TaxID=83212 RepID=A0A8K0NIW1_9HYPO|nr:hypothetical protein E4U42_003571 [Claviceps africana]